MWFNLETIVAWAKRKWFVYPNSEIYGGLANARDLDLWLCSKEILWFMTKHFTQERDDVLFMDTTIITSYYLAS